MIKRILCALLLALVMLGLCACGKSSAGEDAPAAVDGVFSVGYAQVDITPTGSVPMSGLGDDAERLSTSVMDHLYATCVAVRDAEGNTVIMFFLDLLNTYDEITKEVRQLVSEATGVPYSNVMMSASHTHSAVSHYTIQNPDLLKHKAEYKELCVQAAKDAIADLKPAQMHGAFSRPEKLNYVRHYVLKDGTYQAYKLGLLPEGSVYGHLWKADNLLQLIKFTREGGKDVVLMNWQAHYAGATGINYTGISADYPSFMRQVVEEELDCHAAFVLGGAGDLTCGSRLDAGREDTNYIEHGKKLGAAAVETAKNFVPLETGNIQLREFPFVAEGTAKENYLYTIGFGDFGIAFAPWEIFDVNAMGVREDSKYPYTFYASCSNGGAYNMYLAHEFAFSYYCYEAETAVYPMGTAEKVQAKLTEMINECFDASGQTQKERAEGYMSSPYVPVSDGETYTCIVTVDQLQEGKNGHYPMTLLAGTTMKEVLVLDRSVAEQIVEKGTMKLLFDERNIVVGVE